MSVQARRRTQTLPERSGLRRESGRGRLRGILRAALVLITGGALGLAATAWVVSHGIEPAEVRVGPWRTWLKGGTPDLDPYGRAILATRGEIAMAATEGLRFVAEVDSGGRPLLSRCDYRVSGPVPAARLWTLQAAASSGSSAAGPADASALLSSDLLRRDDGSFDIEASRQVRPGNWLEVPGRDTTIRLVLRLYDTPLTAMASEVQHAPFPLIERQGCAP